MKKFSIPKADLPLFGAN